MTIDSDEPNSAAPRLLFDQNLALVRKLVDLYSGSVHVREIGLAASEDESVWEHAVANGFTIVTKDDDFRHEMI